jgi:hypothetical protein
MCFLPLLMVLYAEGNGEYPMLDKAREKESPAHSTNIFRRSLRKILQNKSLFLSLKISPAGWRGLLLGEILLIVADDGLQGAFLFLPILESLEHAAWVFRCAPQCIENSISHFNRRLEGFFLTAILAVGEILGELVPLAADAESPSLEGCCLVRVSGNITLGHMLLPG